MAKHFGIEVPSTKSAVESKHVVGISMSLSSLVSNVGSVNCGSQLLASCLASTLKFPLTTMGTRRGGPACPTHARR